MSVDLVGIFPWRLPSQARLWLPGTIIGATKEVIPELRCHCLRQRGRDTDWSDPGWQLLPGRTVDDMLAAGDLVGFELEGVHGSLYLHQFEIWLDASWTRFLYDAVMRRTARRFMRAVAQAIQADVAVYAPDSTFHAAGVANYPELPFEAALGLAQTEAPPVRAADLENTADEYDLDLLYVIDDFDDL